MKKIIYDDSMCSLLKREQRRARQEVIESVERILQAVKAEGDTAIKRYTRQFDCTENRPIAVSLEEQRKGASLVSQELRKALRVAEQNIRVFHESQLNACSGAVETTPGVVCWRKKVPLSRVGLYIPGGSAPLFSTFLMLAIPAKAAGCKEIVVVTPPRRDGTIDPTLCYLAEQLDIKELYAVGGVQAIAALAYGTESIRPVDKICGPGNEYVTEAKKIVAQECVAIDLPAGPSEVMVIADSTIPPEWIAADLLSQAEHDTESRVLLAALPEVNLDKVEAALAKQLETLPRAEIAKKALQESILITVSSLDEAITIANDWAPEHLIIAINEPIPVAEKIVNAGSVFLGKYTPESFGDYASGTNHVLPTAGWAKAYSGVSIDTFQKSITFQAASLSGLMNLGETVTTLAEAEGLSGHAQAVNIRMEAV